MLMTAEMPVRVPMLSLTPLSVTLASVMMRWPLDGVPALLL
ncbi:hypothetical protein [Azospirillum brasilense]|nr:hypothetical protein [Azospirillum brasilense]